MKKRLKRKKIAKIIYGYHCKFDDIKNSQEYLQMIEELLNKYVYEHDDDFILAGRKQFLYNEINDVLDGIQWTNCDPLYFVLGSLEEFICDHNHVYLDPALTPKNDRYSDKGIICLEERLYIDLIIDRIKQYINDRLANNIEFNNKHKKNIDIDAGNLAVDNMNNKKCPHCDSPDLWRYLYGEHKHNYDKDKYVLGGCVMTFDHPTYKCKKCGKDIYYEDFASKDDKNKRV